MSTSWILVCDAARARLFETSHRGGGLVEIACYTNPDLRGVSQQWGLGRAVRRRHESTGPTRRTLEPHTSRREKSARVFAHLLVSSLFDAHARDRYDHLFVIAAPQFLGTLRQYLDDLTASGLAGELSNDFVGSSVHDLHHHLQDAFPRDFRARAALARP